MSWQIDEEHNVKFMQGNQQLMVRERSSMSTFVKYFLMIF